MNIKNVESYRDQLEALLSKHSPHSVELLIVPDIADWYAEKGAPCSCNPIAQAIVDLDSGAWGILLRNNIDGNTIRSVLDRISFNGTHDAHHILSTPILFLSHTIFHELGHLAINWGQEMEDDCDDWAFERLKESLQAITL